MGTLSWNISAVSMLIPPHEAIVKIDNVRREDGFFTAAATLCNSLVAGGVSSSRVQIGWITGCNDWPEAGQHWMIRVLGYDHPSGTWLAHALIRES